MKNEVEKKNVDFYKPQGKTFVYVWKIINLNFSLLPLTVTAVRFNKIIFDSI